MGGFEEEREGLRRKKSKCRGRRSRGRSGIVGGGRVIGGVEWEGQRRMRRRRRRIVHYVMCNSFSNKKKKKIVNISWVVLVCYNFVTNMSPNIGWMWRLMII